jgi:PIN like domain
MVAAGYVAHTLRSHYGSEDAARRVKDHKWVSEAARSSWIILTKDDIRRDALAFQAFVSHEAKVFFLPDRGVGRIEIHRRYLGHLPGILSRSSGPGPFMYAVHSTTLELIHP